MPEKVTNAVLIKLSATATAIQGSVIAEAVNSLVSHTGSSTNIAAWVNGLIDQATTTAATVQGSVDALLIAEQVVLEQYMQLENHMKFLC